MNLKTLYTITFYTLIGVISTACVQDYDYEISDILETENDTIAQVLPLQSIIKMIAQQQAKEGRNAKVIFEADTSVITGYVVSNDQAGNFYKELVIQDHPSQPTSGIRVLLDQQALYTYYEFGRKVIITLSGLSAGIENGVPTLGVLEADQITAIPRMMLTETVKRTSEIATITAVNLTEMPLTEEWLNTYIQIDQVQFAATTLLNASTFAAEPRDWFDGERLLERCFTKDTVVVSTSTFASFKGMPLPKYQGRIIGILTKDYSGKTLNLVLNDLNGISFAKESRCVP